MHCSETVTWRITQPILLIRIKSQEYQRTTTGPFSKTLLSQPRGSFVNRSARKYLPNKLIQMRLLEKVIFLSSGNFTEVVVKFQLSAHRIRANFSALLIVSAVGVGTVVQRWYKRLENLINWLETHSSATFCLSRWPAASHILPPPPCRGVIPEED